MKELDEMLARHRNLLNIKKLSIYSEKMKSKLRKYPETERYYFKVQAEIGITKHMGGIKATDELVELCHIDKDKYVLDVGTGVGITPCYLAKKYGCRVVGVDTYERMIERSKERAKREGVKDRVKFIVADVQNLPFEDNLFDAVIGESITAFSEDKQKAVNEYVKVTAPGGYVGLNECTWIKEKPPKELVDYLFHAAGGVMIETPDSWRGLLQDAGLKDIVVRTYKVNSLTQFLDEIRRVGSIWVIRGWYRLLRMYITGPAQRKGIQKMMIAAKNITSAKNMFEYFGYGIYVGRK